MASPGPLSGQSAAASSAAVPPLPAILDIEASGFGTGSFPIEIGLVMPDGESFCTLIRPEAGWKHWDAQAEAVHGLARSQLECHGRPVGEVARMLNERLLRQNVYCDGWLYDYSWLNRLFDAADNIPAFHLKDLRELLTPRQAGLWHDTRQDVEAYLQLRRHRASTDALIIQETLRQVRVLTGGR
jgi:hypothetical protein